jgi:hypothetical protein
MSSDSETSREKKAISRKSKKHHKKKHRKTKHKKRKRDYYSSSDESSSRHKKRKKKRGSRDYSSDSSDEDRSSDSSRRERKRRRKEKKKKSKASAPPNKPTFGQYGIIKASDMHKKQRSFQVWLAEVKGIHDFNGPRWELQNYFADYMEDYNTATMPHVKYYDYDAWELQEYQKKQRDEQEGGSTVQADEARHRQEMRQRAEEKQKAELLLLRQTMNKDKISDMKHKAQLQSELAHAFKTGDVETQRRIQKKLEPEK